MTSLEQIAATKLRAAIEAGKEALGACLVAGCDGDVVFRGCSESLQQLEGVLLAVEGRS